jgi:hypothetical protein
MEVIVFFSSSVEYVHLKVTKELTSGLLSEERNISNYLLLDVETLSLSPASGSSAAPSSNRRAPSCRREEQWIISPSWFSIWQIHLSVEPVLWVHLKHMYHFNIKGWDYWLMVEREMNLFYQVFCAFYFDETIIILKGEITDWWYV